MSCLVEESVRPASKWFGFTCSIIIIIKFNFLIQHRECVAFALRAHKLPVLAVRAYTPSPLPSNRSVFDDVGCCAFSYIFKIRFSLFCRRHRRRSTSRFAFARVEWANKFTLFALSSTCITMCSTIYLMIIHWTTHDWWRVGCEHQAFAVRTKYGC